MLNRTVGFKDTRTAVLVIDASRGHLDPSVATMPLNAETAKNVVHGMQGLIELCRKHALPIVYVNTYFRYHPIEGAVDNKNPFWMQRDGTMVPGRKNTILGHNREGSAGTELMPEIAPQEGDFLVVKKRRSAFFNTDMDTLLRNMKVDRVIVSGVNTNTCILATIFDAFNRDYEVWVVKEAVQSMYGQDLHEFALQAIQRTLGNVVSLQELAELLDSK